MFEEEWIRVNDAQNYAVSNHGRVLNIRTKRILKQDLSNGCRRVYLQGRNYRVHRLVAEAYCPGYAPHLDVNHLDGNKQNNNACNLEWSTRQANIHHAFRTGLSVSGRRTPIRIVETGEVFDSQLACAKAIGGWQPSINAVLKGKSAHHKGYTFEYAD